MTINYEISFLLTVQNFKTVESLLLRGGSKSQVLTELELNIVLAYLVGSGDYNFDKAIHLTRDFTRFHNAVAPLLDTKSEAQTHFLYIASLIMKHKM